MKRETKGSRGPDGLYVLVVEDNDINQELVVRILQRAGYRADVASDGSQAVQATAGRRYDLILMDCQMPGMDGFAATRKIRERETDGVHIPILALTAHAMKGDRERCFAAGMDDYLTKPIEPDGLVAKIREWTASESGASSSFDYHKALARCMNDENLLRRLLRRFEERLDSQLRELRRKIEKGALDESTGLAHSIKGTASQLEASNLARLASEIEGLLKVGREPEPALLDALLEASSAFKTDIARITSDPGA